MFYGKNVIKIELKNNWSYYKYFFITLLEKNMSKLAMITSMITQKSQGFYQHKRGIHQIELLCENSPWHGHSGVSHRSPFRLDKKDIYLNHLYKKIVRFAIKVKPKVFWIRSKKYRRQKLVISACFNHLIRKKRAKWAWKNHGWFSKHPSDKSRD